MRRTISFILMVSLVACFVPVIASAEEELFDTKAAAEGIEKGLNLLKAKKYDAAVEAFEEAAAISPDIEAEALYYAGYACYMKGKSGDEDARQLSVEFFERAYEIDPNFSPNKFKPTEPMPGTPAAQAGDVTPAAAAPAGALAMPPVQQAPAAPAEPAKPDEQPKQ